MTTVVASLLEKAGGPKALRSALRAKGKPLNALLRSINALKTVPVEAPEMLSGGGDLVALMSRQMQALLTEDERPPVAAEATHRRNPGFTGGKIAAVAPGRNHTSVLYTEKARSTGFDAMNSGVEKRGRFSDLTDLPDRSLPTYLPAYLPSVADAPDEFQPLPSPGENDPGIFQRPTGSAKPAESRQGAGIGSLLAKKLMEYWELSKTEQGLKNGSGHAAADPSPRELPGVLPPQFRHGERPWQSMAEAIACAPGQPGVEMDAERSRRSWPEATAGQLARKLRSLGADAASARASQSVSSASAGRVEIQNVFNIEISAGSNGGAAFTDGLAENLSDILREQALQHGIDLT